jgi:hypothetical protein
MGEIAVTIRLGSKTRGSREQAACQRECVGWRGRGWCSGEAARGRECGQAADRQAADGQR